MKNKLASLTVLFSVALIWSANSPNINNLQVFPPDNPWNWDISKYKVHSNSINFINSIGVNTGLHPDFGTTYNNAPNGIPYITVGSGEPKIPVVFTDYGDESDSGPYPIPLTAPVEGGPASDGDRHVIAVDTADAELYELYYTFPQTGYWEASCGAKFNLKSNALRPKGWTSADAAGLPIFPGLVRYEEVYIKKEIKHALRFTADTTQRAYIYPARHYASSQTSPNRPPMGLRVRLKAGVNINTYSSPARVILTALKKYGMILADNGGDWYISGAPDDRWNDDSLNQLKSIRGSDFEAVATVDSAGNPIYPPIALEAALPRVDAARVQIITRRQVFVFETTFSGNADLRVFDLRGRRVDAGRRMLSPGQVARLDLRGIPLAGGVYTVELSGDAGRTARKFVLLP